MQNVDRIDINRKWPVPSWVPMMLLLAAISGFLISRCGHSARDKYIVFFNVEIQEITTANIDITFEAYNRSKVDLNEEGVLIRVYDKTGEEVASKITTIDLASGENKRFLKMLTKFTKPVKNPDEIVEVTVELYHASLFK